MFSLKSFHESRVVLNNSLFQCGQGAGFSTKPNIHEARWLKQLKVAISTRASMPTKVKSTKFVKQILSTCTAIVVISSLRGNVQKVRRKR
jgi:hypothetical protein